jgi:hypothetical protein
LSIAFCEPCNGQNSVGSVPGQEVFDPYVFGRTLAGSKATTRDINWRTHDVSGRRPAAWLRSGRVRCFIISAQIGARVAAARIFAVISLG